MNPVVVIATHERTWITTRNVELLLAQEPRPKIVLVVSTIEELNYYTGLQKPHLHVVICSNNPLGNKWQQGVNFARDLVPSHLVILGSDDILAKGFFSVACCEKFIGLYSWYIWDGTILYEFKYNATQPLGGGRVYPRDLLDLYDWNLFDTHATRLLDDYGWEVARGNGPLRVEGSSVILAIKGNWPVMNPVRDTLRHRNATLLGKWVGGDAVGILTEKFGYDIR